MLPELVLDATAYMDRTVILYGGSDTGKSTLIADIAHSLKPHIDQVTVICPTDPANHTYDSGMVPLPLIHYDLSESWMKRLWDRQMALVNACDRAQNYGVLEQTFQRIPIGLRERETQFISHAKKKVAEFERSVTTMDDKPAADEKVRKMNADLKKILENTYKKCINNHRSALLKLTLSDDEKHAIKYLNTNPRMLLIFDDCTEAIKKHGKSEYMQKLFFAGRHAKITALLACHTDEMLDPRLRKNAFLNIFTEYRCAALYFERKANGFTKEDIKKAKESVLLAFNDTAPFQKLAWSRKNSTFYRFTATKHENFRFGSDAIWEYCKRAMLDVNTLGSDNAYSNSFN
jgi:ABC-type lipoprotein export system ATPase subunit